MGDVELRLGRCVEAELTAVSRDAYYFAFETSCAGGPHPLADLRDGFLFVVRTRWLLWTLLFASMWVLLAMGPMDVLLPFIARERFAHGEQMYGFALAAFGLGSALGALTVSSRPLPRR